MQSNYKGLSIRLKLIILFIDYIIVISLISILDLTFKLGEKNPWIFWASVYSIYYVLPELYYNRTLTMKFFGVKIGKTQNRLNRTFLLYSFLIFLDRIVLLIIYIFRLLLQGKSNLLISEKYSGLRWLKTNE